MRIIWPRKDRCLIQDHRPEYVQLSYSGLTLKHRFLKCCGSSEQAGSTLFWEVYVCMEEATKKRKKGVKMRKERTIQSPPSGSACKSWGCVMGNDKAVIFSLFAPNHLTCASQGLSLPSRLFCHSGLNIEVLWSS